MSRLKKVVKWSLITLAGLVALVAGFGWWFISLLPSADTSSENPKDTLAGSLPYLTNSPVEKRGKILAVVTSTGSFEGTDKKTGYELTELSQAYYVFLANGFEMDIASPRGGEPPMVLDDDDMESYDYAFLNDTSAQRKLRSTIPMDSVQLAVYEGIYFVGGKGVMFDFPDHEGIQHAVKLYHEQDKVIGAVCHGPAAFVNVKLADGTPFLKDKRVCSFTNREELFLIKNARELLPFLLQDKLTERGAVFAEGALYLENVIVDGNLVTGQNPWSTWATAEAMVTQLGYEPKERQKTASENAVRILAVYENKGYGDAKLVIEELSSAEKQEISRQLIAMHALVAVMQGELKKGLGIIGLLRYTKSLS
ncbi:hypothetical protein GCM10009119_05400 [Algoriphagus jejuensis]|uniref:DJ-1/PfpI domain-containing protein n=1 Tax=Algoriphagus jejuensis TaxID=419934 RepID=A0ABN1MVX6_9BACT